MSSQSLASINSSARVKPITDFLLLPNKNPDELCATPSTPGDTLAWEDPETRQSMALLGEGSKTLQA
jgi:hypothetical protein